MINLLNFLLFAADITPEAAPAEPTAPILSPVEMVPGYEGAFLKMFLTLLALVIGIFITVWILKKFSQGRWSRGSGSRTIRIIEKKPLSPKTMLYLIDVDGQQSVIAESQLEVKNLMTLEKALEESKT